MRTAHERRTEMTQGGVKRLDEQENAVALALSTGSAPLTVDRRQIGEGALPLPWPFGWQMPERGEERSPLFAHLVVEERVSVLISSAGCR
jgi:hypothetical protein